MRAAVLVCLCGLVAPAEVRRLTMREAMRMAGEKNPEVVLALLDEQKAALQVRVAQDPFVPKIAVGSGLAYSHGFPMSIEGSAPSVFQAQAIGTVYNAPLRYRVAQARENVRGTALEVQTRREEALLRTALQFLDAEHLGKALETARRQAESLRKVEEAVRARVGEGRELPIEARRAALHSARARQRVAALEADLEAAERALALVVGLGPEDRARPAGEERQAVDLPESEDAAAGAALEGNREIRRLESALLAKGLETRSHRSARLPRVDLVAQYGLFARFNNYEDFFRKFQRHNGQLGVSLTLPLVTGSADKALASQSEIETARLRVELNRRRNQIALDARKSHQEARKAETDAEVARLDLELAREQVSLLLARMGEGRAAMREVEQARFDENEKWLAFLAAQYTLEKARLDLLKRTGGLLAALR